MFLKLSRSTKVFLGTFQNGICLPRKIVAFISKIGWYVEESGHFCQKCVPDHFEVRIVSCSWSKYSTSKDRRIIMKKPSTELAFEKEAVDGSK